MSSVERGPLRHGVRTCVHRDPHRRRFQGFDVHSKNNRIDRSDRPLVLPCTVTFILLFSGIFCTANHATPGVQRRDVDRGHQ